jgi:serine/threonine protein kinase
MTEVAPAFARGARLGDGGRYQIRRRVGVGGMAEVYKAIDTRLGDRVVAIKTLLPSVASHPFADKMRRLFIQEAQALSRIHDENVVAVLDFGAQDGTPYMVMEFLRGSDLGAFLRRTKDVAIDEAVDVVLGVCAGVYACHLAGIIHRDLKPANVFLNRTLNGQQAKVLDFSVAKAPIARSAGLMDQTGTDLIVGTPSYMSPEQALGRPATELSDQYSIGALLYRCLTGRPPHGLLPKLREVRPEMPAELESVLLQSLEPKPGKRFATVHELGHRLVPFASPAVRERWKPYYHALPRPFDTNTTETIVRKDLRAAKPADPASQAATAAAVPYDFEAHERSTSIDTAAKTNLLPEPASSMRLTAVDPPPSTHPSIADSSSPTIVDSPPSAPGPVSLDQRSRLAEGQQAGGASPLPSRPPVDRARLKIIVGFGLAAVVVIGVAMAGVMRLERRPDRRPSFILPAVRPLASSPGRTPAPGTPPPPTASDRAPHVPPPQPGPAPVLPVVNPSLPGNVGTAEQPERPRRRRPHSSASDGIQYGADGLPILH